ncbi:MAG: hypothetical protein LBT15_00710 [Synergistaceae bacterium]|nr:hypothetical protein [Synergistaceae bacterium]
MWFRIVLFSMLLGGLWRLDGYYAWMSLRGYHVRAADPFLERRFWDVFPSESLRFWPSFLRRSQDIAFFLERTVPVVVKTRMTGFGTFLTSVDPLTPWALVEWRGQVWCLSREGRMWNTADENAQVAGMRIPERPLWRVSASGTAGGDESPLPGGVFPFLFPVKAIENFLDGFGKSSWFGYVAEVAVDRRGGADLFTLRYVREKRTFAVLIQRNPQKWQELNTALEHILERLWKEDGNHLIDATYEDRIVVRDLSAGAGEGSSK